MIPKRKRNPAPLLLCALILCLSILMVPSPDAEAATVGTPSITSVTAKSGTSLTVSWTAVPDASGYEVYRSKNSTGPFYRVASTTARYYTNTGLLSGVAYYYRIRAYQLVETTKVYGTLSAKKAGVPLAAPAIKSVESVTGTSLKITWGSVPGAYGYALFRSTSKTGTYKQIYVGRATSYTNSGLTSGTMYYYKLKALQIVSSVKYYSAFGTHKIGAPLAAPKIISANGAGAASVKVEWEPVTGATHYILYRSATKTGTYRQVYIGTAKSFTNSSLINGNLYFYKVKALKKVSTLKFYSALGLPKAGTPIAVPQISSIVFDKVSSATITWSAAKGAAGYSLYRSISADGPFKLIASTTSTSFTNKYLSEFTKYYYKVNAFKSINNVKYFSNFSPVKSMTTLIPGEIGITGPYLPTVVADTWFDEFYLVTIDEITYTTTDWGSTYIYFSGSKTYDSEGSYNNMWCSIDYKLYNAAGAVVDSGAFFTPDLYLGESFYEVRVIVFDLKPGLYRLELINDL